jgi:hypothetical protein
MWERCERSLDECVPIQWPPVTVSVGTGADDLDASSGDR